MAYETMLETEATLAGTITMSFRIMPDGSFWDLAVEADSVLESLVPLIDSLFDGAMIELTQNIMEPIPVTVPMELQPAD